MRQNFCKRFRKFRPLISAVGEERLQKWIDIPALQMSARPRDFGTYTGPPQTSMSAESEVQHPAFLQN